MAKQKKILSSENFAIIITILFLIFFIANIFYHIFVGIGYEKGVRYSAGELIWDLKYICRELAEVYDPYAEIDIEQYDTGMAQLLILKCVYANNSSRELVTLRLNYN